MYAFTSTRGEGGIFSVTITSQLAENTAPVAIATFWSTPGEPIAEFHERITASVYGITGKQLVQELQGDIDEWDEVHNRMHELVEDLLALRMVYLKNHVPCSVERLTATIEGLAKMRQDE